MNGRHRQVSIQPAQYIQACLLSSSLQGGRPGDAALTLQLLRLQAQHCQRSYIIHFLSVFAYVHTPANTGQAKLPRYQAGCSDVGFESTKAATWCRSGIAQTDLQCMRMTVRHRPTVVIYSLCCAGSN